MTDQDPKTGRFVAGNKANPGGRPKAEVSITALIDQAVSPTDWMDIIQKLLKMARAGNLKAIEMLMDRRFGKALQTTELTGKDGGPIKTINTLEVTPVDYRTAIAALAPGPMDNSEPSSQNQSPVDGQAVG